MSSNYIFSKSSFSFIVKDFPRYWMFVKENITLIIIVLSLLGGLNQIVNFLLLSADLIVYYSPSQGILDGVLFLIFVLLVLGFYFAYGVLSIWISETQDSVYKWVTYCSALIFCVTFFFYLAVNLHQFIFAAWLMVPFYVLSHLLTSQSSKMGSIKEDELRKNEENSNAKDADVKKFSMIVFFYFSVLAFVAYVSIFYNLHKNSIENIENTMIIEAKVNKGTNNNFKLVYNNGNYVFLKDQISSKIIVVHIDSFTKN